MIYTKTGDDGTTSLVGGTRVKKYDIRVETYGEIDHLVGLLGFASTFLRGLDCAAEILVIQNKLFVIESMVACEDAQLLERLTKISDVDVKYLERKIDEKTKDLTPLTRFIIPSGSQTATILNVATTQTRRCERLLVKCNDTYPQNPIILQYINRLSDYLFTLSRWIMKEKNVNERYFNAN